MIILYYRLVFAYDGQSKQYEIINPNNIMTLDIDEQGIDEVHKERKKYKQVTQYNYVNVQR